MRGKIIVITGIDGSGKTVQTTALYERLTKEGYPVETIDYPRYGKTFFGDLVGRYLRGEFGKLNDVSPYLAATLFAGDRFETRDMLEGWLNAGKIILANRYVADNIAHQGVRAGSVQDIDKFAEWLTRLEHGVYKLPKADINILLSLPPTIAYKLVALKTERAYLEGKKRDIHEDSLGYLEATSRCFHRLALKPDWRIIECVDDHNTTNLSSVKSPDIFNLLSETFIAGKVWDCVDEFLKTRTVNHKEMTREEKNLLFYLEKFAVDYGGLISTSHINLSDLEIIRKWNETGFVRLNRLSGEYMCDKWTHWCEFSEEAWKLAQAERRERYERIVGKRVWRTAEERSTA